MAIGYKQIAKVICIACGEPLGEHRKKELARCLFRIQGTMVSNGIENDASQNTERQLDQSEDIPLAKGFNTGVG
jgi:hypothetical protein